MQGQEGEGWKVKEKCRKEIEKGQEGQEGEERKERTERWQTSLLKV